MHVSPPVNSIEASLNTIKTDPLVHGWFGFLLRNPQVKSRLSAHPEHVRLLQQLDRLTWWRTINEILLAVFLVVPVLCGQYIYFLITVLLFAGVEFLIREQIRIMSRILKGMIEEDFPGEALGRVTLYHMCELYSQKYALPGLVEAIHLHDLIARRVVAGSIVVIFLIYPWTFRTGQAMLLFWFSYFALLRILRCPWFYTFLQSRWRTV